MAIETFMRLARSAGYEPLPIPKTRSMGNAPYDAAGRGRRGIGWQATRLGGNTLLYSHGLELVARSRDAVRNGGWAARAVDAFVANAIGRGIRLVHQHPDEAVRSQITTLWNRWCKECDVEYEPSNPCSGQTDFAGQQVIAAREIFEAGEVFVRFRVRRISDRLSVPLQLQLIESEQLPYYRMQGEGIPPDNMLRSGIEFRPDGRRAAYHMWKAHPGETIFYPADSLRVERVPAKDVLHCFKPLRAGQLRGQPWLTPVLAKLYELDQYVDSEVVRKKTSSMLTGFLKEITPDNPILPIDAANSAGGSPSDIGADIAKLEPGTFVKLNRNEDVEFAKPEDSGDFASFVKTILRAFAVGSGLTYEQISGDLEGVNYSSIRAGLLEMRRICEQFQYSTFIYQFCHPIFRRWLLEAVISGALPFGNAYYDDPTAFESAIWVTPGWPWVDPEKDIGALRDAVRDGFDTRARIVSERGQDVEAIDEQQAIDNARADKLGLVYDTDPRKVMIRGSKSPENPPPADEESPAEQRDKTAERETFE